MTSDRELIQQLREQVTALQAERYEAVKSKDQCSKLLLKCIERRTEAESLAEARLREIKEHDEYLHGLNAELGKAGIRISDGPQDGIVTLINQRDDALAVLRQVEWSEKETSHPYGSVGVAYDGVAWFCGRCGWWNVIRSCCAVCFRSQARGHADDCALAAVLPDTGDEG